MQENESRLSIIGSFIEKYFPDKTWKRKLLKYFIIPIAILLIGYILFNDIIMPLVTRHGSEFALPDIVGYEYHDAKDILNMADLNVEIIAEEYHPDKEDGTIISQYPVPGTLVKSGRLIKVVKSIGRKDVIVPQLSGFSVRQAVLNIEAAGLLVGDINWTHSDSLPERVVVFSYPASGTKIPMGSHVNLMVNRGSLAGIVYMPRLIGRPLEEARRIIEDMELKVGLVTHVTNENYLPETVLEQSVPPATELDVGEEIDLIVSTTE